MELYSLTTGLIGQSGRRGALMLTIDVKHPDIKYFLKVKKNPNWVTKQIIEQCNWSGLFNELELETIKKQVMENTQVRFANISIKASDEFMHAVDEENEFGKKQILPRSLVGIGPKASFSSVKRQIFLNRCNPGFCSE